MKTNLAALWYWEHSPVSLAQIAQGDFLSLPETAQTAWSFAQQWLAGQASFCLQTSGSTGAPKPITLSRAQMQASAHGTAQALGLAEMKTALLAINPQYIGGKMMLVRALQYDLTLTAIATAGNPLRRLQEIFGYVPAFDFIALVPAQIHAIATETPHLLPALNQSKAIILGGGAISDAVQKVVETLEVPIYNTYGMTETVSHIALRRLNGQASSPYFEAFEGVQLALDERSCLRICAEVTAHEWIQTNDVVELPDAHRFIWLGRADNILNSGGVKIQIEALEARIEGILREMGLPAPFAIVGVPDEKWQEKVVLCLELDNLPADRRTALEEVLRARLTRYEVPKQIIALPTLPRTETGKIQRLLLRELGGKA